MTAIGLVRTSTRPVFARPSGLGGGTRVAPLLDPRLRGLVVVEKEIVAEVIVEVVVFSLAHRVLPQRASVVGQSEPAQRLTARLIAAGEKCKGPVIEPLDKLS